MKLTKTLSIAVIGTVLTMATRETMAASSELTISGKILEQGSTTTKKDTQTTTTTSISLNSAFLFDLISNSVANVGTNGTGVASTNFPSGSYIAFDPNGNDGMVGGTFYVTNKTGLYYPLSGLDTNGNYYSFIELDAYNNDPNNSAGQLNFGFSGNFNGIETGNLNTTTGDGTAIIQSTAVFYVHDNAYSFNDGDNASIYFSNNNSLEIRGNAEIHITYKNNEVKDWSVSLSGSGNAVVDNTQNAIVTDGHVSVSSPQ